MPRSALSAPVTLLVTRHIQPERYGDFPAWMRQGEILAAGFPGFLGSGAAAAGGRRPVPDRAALRRRGQPGSLGTFAAAPHVAGARRGAGARQRVRRARGMDGWFGQGPSAPPRWKQAVSIWLAYFPLLLMFSALLGERLAALPTFWRALLTSVALTPVMVYACIPLVTRLLRRWLRPADGVSLLPSACCGGSRPTCVTSVPSANRGGTPYQLELKGANSGCNGRSAVSRELIFRSQRFVLAPLGQQLDDIPWRGDWLVDEPGLVWPGRIIADRHGVLLLR